VQIVLVVGDCKPNENELSALLDVTRTETTESIGIAIVLPTVCAAEIAASFTGLSGDGEGDPGAAIAGGLPNETIVIVHTITANARAKRRSIAAP